PVLAALPLAKQRNIIFLILLLMTFAQLGTDIYLPSFPAISNYLRVDVAYVQMTYSIFLVGFALSQIIYGPLSDYYGRKPFLLIGVFLYFLMALVSSKTNSITVLMIARALQGVGAGACSVIPRAIMRDLYSGYELEKISSYQTIVWSFVPISAPLMGSYIQYYWGWRYNFLFLAAISCFAFILCLFFRESHSKKEKELKLFAIMKQYSNIIVHQSFYPSLVCCMGATMMLIAFEVSAPVIIQQHLGLSTIQFGWSIFMVSISFFLGSIINRILIKSLTPHTIIGYGFFLVFIAILLIFASLLFLKLSIQLFLIPMFILQIGISFIFPSNAAKAMQAFPDSAGKAAAVFGCVMFLGGTVAGLIISVLPDNTLLPMAIVYSVILAIMYYFYRLPRETRRMPYLQTN
ncbi:MAG: Bcr/CflA family efflux MFS transporter, partial [Legionella sp.]